MRAFYLAACLLLCAIPAYAQSFEAGASIAASCRGSEGSLCYESGLATFGPYASIWFADRIELGVRAVWLKRDDYQVESGNSPDDAFALTDRSRLVAQGEFIWHFRRGKRARPMVGFGAGVFRDRDVVTCDSPTCRVWIPSSMVGPGEYTTSHRD